AVAVAVLGLHAKVAVRAVAAQATLLGIGKACGQRHHKVPHANLVAHEPPWLHRTRWSLESASRIVERVEYSQHLDGQPRIGHANVLADHDQEPRDRALDLLRPDHDCGGIARQAGVAATHGL